MQIAFHIGAHCTGGDRLIKSLLRSREELSKQDISVPGPSRYRPILRETMGVLRGEKASAEMQETLLDAIMDEDDPKRLILSNHNFLAPPQKVLAQHTLYPMAAQRADWMARVFFGTECEYHMAIRNPATFVPDLFALSGEKDFGGFIAGADPFRLAWSDTVRRLRLGTGDSRIVIWCEEDTPLIWPRILEAVSGCTPGTRLEGENDVLHTLMHPIGIKRMFNHMRRNPPEDEAQRIRTTSEFLERFARAELLETEITLPGWTQQVIDQLTDRYEDDLEVIAKMEGVEFLTP